MAGGSVGMGLLAGESVFPGSVGSASRAAKSLRILILGGTGFTGPFQVRYALSLVRGGKVADR